MIPMVPPIGVVSENSAINKITINFLFGCVFIKFIPMLKATTALWVIMPINNVDALTDFF